MRAVMIRTLLPLLPLLLVAGPAEAQVARSAMLSGFDRIRVDGPFAVTVTQGTRASAIVNGARTAAEKVSVRVENGTLVVSANVSGWGGWAGEDPPATVTVSAPPGTRAISVRGGGTVAVDRIRGQRVDLAVAGSGTLNVAAADADLLYATMTGAGRLEVAGRAGQARFLVQGTGAVDARALAVDDLQVSQDSLGDGVYAARRTVTVSSAGLGAVTVEGDAACRVVVQRGGPVSCKRVKAR